MDHWVAENPAWTSFEGQASSDKSIWTDAQLGLQARAEDVKPWESNVETKTSRAVSDGLTLSNNVASISGASAMI
jgi:hypothetical protein